MPGHNTLGLTRPNGQAPAGLGLVRETNTAAAAASAVPSQAAPVVGVERTEIGSPADLQQRAPAPAPAPAPAKPKSAIPQFSENPLAAIGIILQEVAAGMRGTEGPVAKANKLALTRQATQMRTQAAVLTGLDAATKTIPRLRPDQIQAYVENFPDIPGTNLKATVQAFADGELEGLDKTIAGLKADPTAVMFMGDVDLSGKSPQEVKALFDQVLAFKTTLTGKVATQAALAPGVDDAAQRRADLEVKTALEKQEALAPGADDAARKKAALAVETALEKQAALEPGLVSLEAKKAAAREKAKGATESALLKGGAIKPSVTSEMRKIAGIAHGGSVLDELTGEVTGLNREQSQNMVKVIAEAERLITDGKATSAATAVIQAVKTVGLPEVLNPEIEISTAMREQLLDQRVEVTVLKGFALDLLGDVSLGTGALSNLQAAMDATLGQVVDLVAEGVFFQDTQEAREDIRLFNQEVKRAIVNNPRFPVAEQEIVQKMLVDPSAWFKNPSTAVVNFRQLIDWIDRKASVTGDLLNGKIPKAVKGGDDDALSAEVNRILGIQ